MASLSFDSWFDENKSREAIWGNTKIKLVMWLKNWWYFNRLPGTIPVCDFLPAFFCDIAFYSHPFKKKRTPITFLKSFSINYLTLCDYKHVESHLIVRTFNCSQTWFQMTCYSKSIINRFRNSDIELRGLYIVYIGRKSAYVVVYVIYSFVRNFWLEN